MRFKILFLVFIFLLLSYKSYAEQQDHRRLVIILVINNIKFDDISGLNTPVFKYLLKNSYLGLMNTRCAKSLTGGAAYLTLGASARCIGDEAGLSFNALELYENSKVSDVYFRRTGERIPNYSVVNLNINLLNLQNLENNFLPVLGALGETLRRAGFKTACIGNADSILPHREIVNIVMDTKGFVDKGNVSRKLLSTSGDFPYGIRTDIDRLFREFKRIKYKDGGFEGVVAIEFGDTSRIDEYSKFLKSNLFDNLKKRALERTEIFLCKLFTEIDFSKTLLLILSPTPSSASIKEGNILTPVIYYTKGTKSGLLTSASTRQKGIITNLDIAPTVLKYLGIKTPEFMYGREMKFLEQKDVKKFLFHLNRRLSLLAVQNTPLLKLIIFYQIIVLLLVLLLILFKENIPGYFLRVANFLLLSLVTLPLSSLLLSLFYPKSLFSSCLYLLLIDLLSVFITIIFFKREAQFIFLCLTTTLILMLDTVFGSKLMSYSPLAFSVMVGARFYGIGNEYMGILISSSLIGFTYLLDHLKERIKISQFAVFSILVILIISLPFFGANFGGAITSIIAFGIVIVMLSDKKISYKGIFYLLFITLIFISFLILVDLSFKGRESHLGRLFLQMKETGSGVFFNLITRKILMNWKLIHYTTWNRILITSLIVIITIFFRPKGRLKEILSTYKRLASGLIGIISGSVAGLVFNDSGIIVVSVGILSLAITLLYLLLQDSLKTKY